MHACADRCVVVDHDLSSHRLGKGAGQWQTDTDAGCRAGFLPQALESFKRDCCGILGEAGTGILEQDIDHLALYHRRKDSQIAKLVGITKNSVTAIRNKSYWNYNNLNPKDPVALNLFTQKDLVDAIEKAERRVKREKKQKEKAKLEQQSAG